MSDAQQPTAQQYRQTAEEIRRFARQSRFPHIGMELFGLAERFDRMAAYLEDRENAQGREAGGNQPSRLTLSSASGAAGAERGDELSSR